jgi:hypothetical protein
LIGMAQHGHPRYHGPVIDVHVHYDATTRAQAAHANAIGGLRAAIDVWDCVWPPTPPSLTIFVTAHFGCFVRDRDRWLTTYPNWFLDTAAAIGDMGHGDVSAVRELFERHPDRILFGTDLGRSIRFEYPDYGPRRRWDLEEYFVRHWRFFETGESGLEQPIPEQLPWTVTGLDLPDATLRALYHDNAARLCGLS